MAVISVKVSEELKRAMKKYRNKVNWPEEVRGFLEGKVEQAEREANLLEVRNLLRIIPKVSKGTAARLVREDRDTGH